jgi:ankyrin repeat protein
MRAGADIDVRYLGGETWLHSAACTGTVEEAEMLLSVRADPNALNDEGETPIFGAVMARRPKVIRTLVAHGADVDVQANEGWTPLRSAIVLDKYECAEVLLESGADVEKRDEEGATPLIVAAYMWMPGAGDFVGLLLAHGANPNAARTIDGLRPLHLAAFHGSDEIVKRLIAAGADVHAKGVAGETAITLARSCQHASTVEILRKHQGRD